MLHPIEHNGAILIPKLFVSTRSDTISAIVTNYGCFASGKVTGDIGVFAANAD
jgi:hypothetical protein